LLTSGHHIQGLGGKMGIQIKANALRASTAFSALLLSLPLQALQDAETDKKFTLEEIMVTAQKKVENLQQTPVTVTALTGVALEQAGITDIRGLAAVTPGLTITGDNQLGTSPIAIRGVGSAGGGIGSDDSVGIYIDGVYLGRPAANTFELVDIERVEILRGPQGTLYGRNATGGAVSFVTKRPSLDEAEGFVGLEYGNFDAIKGKAYVSAPISDTVAFKVAATFSRRDGFAFNAFDGSPDVINEAPERLLGEEAATIRAAILFDKDALDILVSADYGYFDQSVPLKDVTNGLGDPDEYFVNAASTQDREFGGISATINYAFSDSLSLTSVTAYRESYYDEIYDSDGTPAEAFRVEPTEDQDQFSEELRLTALMENGLEIMIGGYFFRENSEWDAPVGPFGATRLLTTNRTTSFAAFANASYPVTEALTLTGGLRYSHEEKDFTFTAGSRFADLPAPGGGEDSWGAVTPRFAIDYKVSDDVFLYASVSRGFKSGGFNLTGLQSFDPEFIWSYEAGTKADLFDSKVRVNMNAFYYDYEDLQVRIPVRPGVVSVTNAAAAEIMGLELEFKLLPTDRLAITGSIAYLDATYDQFDVPVYDTDVSSPTLGEIIDVVDLSGNRLNRAPEWKLNLNAEYLTPLGGAGDLTLRAEYVYESEIFFTEQNISTFGRGGFHIVNARAVLEPSDNWAFSAFVENIGDERFVANIIPIAGLPQGFASLPRTYGIAINYSF